MSDTDDRGRLAAEQLLAHFAPDLIDGLLAGRSFEHAPAAIGAQPVLSLGELEQALGDGRIRANQLRLALGRKMVDPASLRVAKGARIDTRTLGQFLNQGAIAVFNQLERTFASVAQLTSALSRRFGVKVEAVGVLNLTQRSGLPAHHDSDNVFILQLAGEKDWDMLGNPVAPGLPAQDAPADDEGTRIAMRPGDALFVPAGQRHQCHASPGGSFHLGLLLRAPTAKVVLDALDKVLREDDALRVPLMTTDAAAEATIRERLHRQVEALDIAALIERERRRGTPDPDFKLRFGGGDS